MATTISEIADLFLATVQDYKINSLLQISGSEAVDTFIQPWLLFAIDDFSVCDQDLTYDKTTKTFSVTLTQKNQNMLARIMGKYWLQKEVQNVLNMANHLQDKDFKTFSTANNLKEKVNLLNVQDERIDTMLTKYALNYGVDWDQWDAQIFR